MKSSPELIEKVRKSEDEFIHLFSNELSQHTPSIIRFYDDEIKDMYDHNFSILIGEMNDEIYQEILKIKEDRKEEHIKVCCSSKNEYLLNKGFEEEILLTMLKEDYHHFEISNLINARYLKASENPKLINKLIEVEIKYYGEDYGEDFCRRRWLRYLEPAIDKNNGLEIWMVFDGDELIGYCYAFENNDVVALDGLLVIEGYRHKYVASNLIKHVGEYYQKPIYLHASEDETPKEMYKKLGFVEIFKSFDYLKLEKEEQKDECKN